MRQIAEASIEQATGIEQVNQTIAQMDEATQQNAALVEEASAAARSMAEQANELEKAASLFRIKATASNEPRLTPVRARGIPTREEARSVAEWSTF